MSKNSYREQSHVQQVIFNLAAFMIVVAGMRTASDIFIPFCWQFLYQSLQTLSLLNSDQKAYPSWVQF